MKRNFLITLALAAALCVSAAGCGGGTVQNVTPGQSNAPAQKTGETYNLRLASIYNAEAPIAQATDWFANRVSELTNGAVTVTPYYNSGLGDYSAVVGEMMAGSIDMAWESVAQAYDDRLYMLSAPYQFTNWDQLEYGYQLDSWFCQQVAKIHEDMGIEQIGNTPGGSFYGIGGSNLGNLDTLFDVKTPQGVLCRSSSSTIAVESVKALGFNNTVIPYSDLYTSLQTGVCDCWYGGSYDLNYDSFRDVVKYYADFRYMCEYIPLTISKATMEKLPAEYQQAIRQAGAEASKVAFDNVKNSEAEYIQKLEDYNIKILVPTDEQLNEISETVRSAVYPQVRELIGDELMDGLLAFLEDVANNA